MPVMPVTKQIEINGLKQRVPIEELALDEVIALALKADREIEDAKDRLDFLKARLIGIAAAKRQPGEKSVRLTALRGGSALVTWGTNTAVDQERAQKLEAELPRGVFTAIFQKATTYKPAPGIQEILRRPQVPELEALKLRIAQAIEFKPKKPSVELDGIEERKDG